jgi:hypothetical protein
VKWELMFARSLSFGSLDIITPEWFAPWRECPSLVWNFILYTKEEDKRTSSFLLPGGGSLNEG